MTAKFPVSLTTRLMALGQQATAENTQRRQGFILRVLLLGSLILSSATVLNLIFEFLTRQVSTTVQNLGVATTILCLFGLLYLLNRRGMVTLAAYCFCSIYELVAVLLILQYGVQLPQAILLFALTIATSSILIGTRASLFFTVLSSLILVGIVLGNDRGYLMPNLGWSRHVGTINDVLVYSFTFVVLLITAWLSNREIERSFRDTQLAKAALQQERDSLEITVEERTRQLKDRQQAEIQQLYEFAYYGRVTASVLHDLANPLSTVALALRKMKSNESSELVKRALENAERIERFVEGARNQLNHQHVVSDFSLSKEIDQALVTLAPLIKKAQVKLTVTTPAQARITGDPIKFFRLVANLVGNSIEACSSKQGERKISVLLKSEKENFHLTIEDTGAGIAKEHLRKIFDPFFTTKSYVRNAGIGLSICKEIVELDFKGQISAESQEGKSTQMHVMLPKTVVHKK